MFNFFMSINIILINALKRADRTLKHDLILKKYIASLLTYVDFGLEEEEEEEEEKEEEEEDEEEEEEEEQQQQEHENEQEQ